MELANFQKLPTTEVAKLVQQAGLKVVVFPINGTRRWFALEYPHETDPQAYLEITWRKHIEIYKLLFEHGVETLVTPIFGPDLLERGEAYQQLLKPGMAWLARNPEILSFYDTYDVRVRIYGDADRYFANTPYAEVLKDYEQVAARTAQHQSRRLFFGVCAHDATESVAQLAVEHFTNQGRVPDKRTIIETYYGEYVEPVSLFIGFDRPSVFDMPLIATGREDLYFMVGPSLYLDEWTLRLILYDHLYSRRITEAYETLTPSGWLEMQEYYRLNRQQVLGIGRQGAAGCIWYPLSQVALPKLLSD